VQSLGLQVCQRLVCCPNRLPHTDAAQIRWAISQFLADEKMMPRCAPPPTARRGTTPVGNWKRILRAVIVECTTTRCKGNALPHSAKSILAHHDRYRVCGKILLPRKCFLELRGEAVEQSRSFWIEGVGYSSNVLQFILTT
jgi:hypothetical protein